MSQGAYRNGVRLSNSQEVLITQARRVHNLGVSDQPGLRRRRIEQSVTLAGFRSQASAPKWPRIVETETAPPRRRHLPTHSRCPLIVTAGL